MVSVLRSDFAAVRVSHLCSHQATYHFYHRDTAICSLNYRRHQSPLVHRFINHHTCDWTGLLAAICGHVRRPIAHHNLWCQWWRWFGFREVSHRLRLTSLWMTANILNSHNYVQLLPYFCRSTEHGRSKRLIYSLSLRLSFICHS